MSVSIYNKTDNKLSSLANQTELMNNDGTADITSQIENLTASVKRNTDEISILSGSCVRMEKLNRNAHTAGGTWNCNDPDNINGLLGQINRGDIYEVGLGTELRLKGTIENVPCIVNGEESTKTVEYDTYFVCVAVDFLRTTKASSGKRSYTFMPFGSPIGTNVIDNATGLGDIHAYSKTFIQQKVMPVYTAHFKNIFGNNLAEFSDPLPLMINKSATSYTYFNGGGRSVENYGYSDSYTSYSLRLPSEPEIFGHYVTSGCYDNSGMESQLPYFANKPITTALTGFGYDTTGGMWLSSYSGMNYYGYYDIDKRTIHARPANAEFGIYPLLTLVQK